MAPVVVRIATPAPETWSWSGCHQHISCQVGNSSTEYMAAPAMDLTWGKGYRAVTAADLEAKVAMGKATRGQPGQCQLALAMHRGCRGACAPPDSSIPGQGTALVAHLRAPARELPGADQQGGGKGGRQGRHGWGRDRTHTDTPTLLSAGGWQVPP